MTRINGKLPAFIQLTKRPANRQTAPLLSPYLKKSIITLCVCNREI